MTKHTNPTHWTTEHLCYLAGIIDGEGTFNINGSQRTGINSIHYSSRVYVVNTDKLLIDWLKKTFGGATYERKHHKWKTRYEWVMWANQTSILVKAVEPYLIVKRKHAKLFLKFRKSFDENPTKRRIDDSTHQFRMECCLEMRHLNS